MWILLSMIALMPFEKNPHLYISANLLGIFPDFTAVKALGLIGVGWVLFELLGNGSRLELARSKQAKAFFALLSTVLLAGIASGAGLTPATRLLSIALFLPLVLMAVRTEAQLLRVLKFSALVLILIFPYAYRQMTRFGGRLGVGLNEPNYVALALLLILPLTLAFATTEKVAWKQKLWMTGMGILVLEMILTGSRGGFLGLVVSFLFLSLRLRKHRMLAVSGLVALLLMVFALPTSLGHRLRASGLDSRVEDTGIRVSNEQRLEVLKAGLRMIQTYPLTGVGLGNFKASTLTFGAEVDRIAHNTFLEMAAELGLPALAAFLCLIYTTFTSLRRTARLATSAGRDGLAEMATALRIGLAGWLVGSLFLSAQFEKFFWLTVFLSICFERIASSRGAPLPGSAPIPIGTLRRGGSGDRRALDDVMVCMAGSVVLAAASPCD